MWHENLIEEIKQSNKRALEAKDSEILILKEQIKAQRQEINEMVPKEQSVNSNIVDRSTDSKKKVIAENIDDNPSVTNVLLAPVVYPFWWDIRQMSTNHLWYMIYVISKPWRDQSSNFTQYLHTDFA